MPIIRVPISSDKLETRIGWGNIFIKCLVKTVPVPYPIADEKAKMYPNFFLFWLVLRVNSISFFSCD